MARRTIRQRRRLFFGAEGKGEYGFGAWLSALCEEAAVDPSWAFDKHDLKGGSPDKALKKAIEKRRSEQRSGGDYAASILLLDADCIENEHDLRRRADAAGFLLIVQRPKHEGILLRLHDGCERRFPTAEEVNGHLLRVWPEVWGGNHRRALDANTLARRFTLADLLRAAPHDPDLNRLLVLLGLRS